MTKKGHLGITKIAKKWPLLKLMEMKDLAVYWHNHSKLDEDFMSKEISNPTARKGVQEINDYFQNIDYEHHYIIEPVYAQSRILRRMDANSLEDESRIESSFLFTKIRFTLSSRQYEEILKVTEYLSMIQKRKKYIEKRPAEDDQAERRNGAGNAAVRDHKCWWKWAFHHLSEKTRAKNKNNLAIMDRVKENNLYVKLYMQSLANEHKDKTVKPMLNQIENKRSLEELKILRQAIYTKLAPPSPTSPNESSSDLDLSEIEVINTTKDKIFLKICFTIQTGEIGIKIPSQTHNKEHVISFDNMIVSQQYKPKSKSSVFNLSLQDMTLQNIFDFQDYRKNFGDTCMTRKIGISEILEQLGGNQEHFRSLHTSNANNAGEHSNSNILQLSYLNFEKHSQINYSMMPMKIYYHKSVIQEIKSFFKPKSSNESGITRLLKSTFRNV